ncbi:hypothetical protein ACFQMA_07685 [Halosimplex aquaticum]|uniref:C2H2-type domain-containing protein n=1 Tax=Halosimplex aquaticum TaxID=3026162 RepID=A0ABD5Y5Q9_9EURY|nr:hypothetical protein [Halosimplex aquaticum]
MAEIWPCPYCEKVFLEETPLRTHSSRMHNEYLRRGDADPEELPSIEGEFSGSPEVAKYSLRGIPSSD